MLAVGIGNWRFRAHVHPSREDNYPAACRAKGNNFPACAGKLAATALFIFTIRRCWVLGAAGRAYTAAGMFVIICGAALQIFGTGFTPLLRNSRKTITAMVIMVVGLITNIVLDWWFIMGLQMGMRGAALATITAQGLVAVFSFIALCRESDPRLHFKPSHFVLRPALCGRILQTAVSVRPVAFPSIILIFNNLQCLAYGGEAAVARIRFLYLVESVTLLSASAKAFSHDQYLMAPGIRQYEPSSKKASVWRFASAPRCPVC
ncbi:MAG: polysaccharide biosynthesis C-terminal domain-containing protein [Christensenellales bacterium]